MENARPDVGQALAEIRMHTRGSDVPESSERSPEVQENCCKVPLSGGGFALIDAEDAERVLRHKWHLGGSNRNYVCTTSGGSTEYLHRVLMNAAPDELVDHANGNGLDCRRSANLRKASRSQNNANRSYTKARSGFRNVEAKSEGRRRFRATVMYCGKAYRCPFVETAEEAARHADMMCRIFYGSFGSYNFPLPGERHCRPVRGGADG